MKQFLKMVGATFVGLSIFSVVSFFGLLIFSALASISSSEEGPVLHLRLEGALDERSSNNMYAKLGLQQYNQGLDDILLAIQTAKTDDNIKGVFLEPGAFSCGTASLEEIRAALLDFRQSGKFVYAYSGAYTQGSYYLCTAADSVFLNPSGTIDWCGLAYRSTFYKRLLEKVGVEMQVVKVGTYKSFTEQYTNEKMSDANREQAEVLVKDLWGVVIDSISASRGISVARLQAAADSMYSFMPADSMLSIGMVDVVAYREDVLNVIRRKIGIDSSDAIKCVNPADYVEFLVPETTGDEVAVVYAVGEIDNGTTEGINTESLCRELNKLAANKDVKAVVMRVNSPGGSAYGSEQVWHSLQELKAKKPLVVSMGDYAASGGYYISCGADYIFAEPTTMTGSIGIFGVIPNIGPLADKIGVDYDVVKTSEGADFPRVFGPMSPVQQNRLQNYVNQGYHLFTKRCYEGRSMEPEELEKIAQGRVWSGVSALNIGLVDSLGTLNDAIAKAAQLAGLKDYHTADYPSKPNFWEQLSETPALGIRAFFKTPKAFEQEERALHQALQLDVLQAAMPYHMVVE